MGDKQVNWAALLPERLRGGPNSDYQKSLRARTEQNAANPIVEAVPQPPLYPPVSSPVGVARGGPIHTKKFKHMVESIKESGGARNPYAVAMAQLGPEEAVLKPHRRREMLAGGYTGHQSDGNVKPFKVAGNKTFEDHQGEYYVNAPVVNILGGPEEVEAIIMDAAAEKIAESEQGIEGGDIAASAPRPIIDGDGMSIEMPRNNEFQFGGYTGVKDIGGTNVYEPPVGGFGEGVTGVYQPPVGGEQPGMIVEPDPNVPETLEPSPFEDIRKLTDPSRFMQPYPGGVFDPTGRTFYGPGGFQTSPTGRPLIERFERPEELETRFRVEPQFAEPEVVTPSPEEPPVVIGAPPPPEEERPGLVTPVLEPAEPEIALPPPGAPPVERPGLPTPVLGPVEPEEEVPEVLPGPVATPADIYVDKSMAALSDMASGESLLMRSIVERTLQRFGSDTAAGKAALRMELGQAGVSGRAANVIMQAYDRNARIVRGGIESDLAQTIMKNAQDATLALADRAIAQQQFGQSLGQRIHEFEETHELALETYDDAETWRTLGFLIDSGASGEEISGFVSRNLGLDIDLSHITDSNQAARFGTAASGLATTIEQYVTGGMRDRINLDDPLIKTNMDRMWTNLGNAEDTIGSDKYNEFVDTTLQSMIQFSSPAMAVINQFSDQELVDAFVGADFVDDFSYGGKTGMEALRGALQYIYVRGGFNINDEGNFETTYDNEAWNVLKPPTDAKVGDVIDLTGQPVGTEKDYAGETYIVVPGGNVMKKTQFHEGSFVDKDGNALATGETILQEGVLYTSKGNYEWTEKPVQDIMDSYNTSGNKWGPEANEAYAVFSGTPDSKEFKQIVQERTDWFYRPDHSVTDYQKLIGRDMSDPVYAGVFNKANPVTEITIKEVSTWPYNTIKFDDLHVGYYKEGNTLYYFPDQKFRTYNWNDENGQMAKVYNVNTGQWVWLDAKEIWKGNRYFSPQDETEGWEVVV